MFELLTESCGVTPLNIQMEAAKKTYHMACKEEKLATTREANGKTEASVTPDQQKKLHEKVDKCKQDVQKVRKGRWSGILHSFKQSGAFMAGIVEVELLLSSYSF